MAWLWEPPTSSSMYKAAQRWASPTFLETLRCQTEVILGLPGQRISTDAEVEVISQWLGSRFPSCYWHHHYSGIWNEDHSKKTDECLLWVDTRIWKENCCCSRLFGTWSQSRCWLGFRDQTLPADLGGLRNCELRSSCCHLIDWLHLSNELSNQFRAWEIIVLLGGILLRGDSFPVGKKNSQTAAVWVAWSSSDPVSQGPRCCSFLLHKVQHDIYLFFGQTRDAVYGIIFVLCVRAFMETF